jgi:rRNA maturation RNase YbeY
MRSESKVYFFFEKKGFTLNKRTLLKAFIEKLFKKEGVPLGSINYIFCSDKKLLEINKTYLKHDYYTDIISFDLSAQGGDRNEKVGLRKNKKLAEIYISVDRIRENAKMLGVSFNNELHRVIFHGALHICGYKDKKQSDRLTMRKKEDHYLVSWGFVPRGTELMS